MRLTLVFLFCLMIVGCNSVPSSNHVTIVSCVERHNGNSASLSVTFTLKANHHASLSEVKVIISNPEQLKEFRKQLDSLINAVDDTEKLMVSLEQE